MIPKLRAWDTVDKKIKEVVTINFDTIRNWDVALSTNQGLPFFKMFEEVELMQSTGLFDKNGVEIFEGDFIKCDGVAALVGLHRFAGMFVKIDDDIEFLDVRDTSDIAEFIERMKSNFEVIGNIYQNPELMNEVANNEKIYR